MKGTILRRHTRVAVATTMAALLLLSGAAACSSKSSDKTPKSSASASAASAAGAKPTAADVAAFKAVKMAGKAGAEPTLTFTKPFTVSAPIARVETKGTGAKLAKGQLVSMNYVAISGKDASKEDTTFGATAFPFTLGAAMMPPALNDALEGQAVGTRVLLAMPAAAAPATATTPATPASATLLAIEIVAAKTIPLRAKGATVAPPAGLPTVALAANGAPTITPVKTTAPTTLVVQPLVKGAGAAITTGQTVTFQYVGALWDGTVFDSSWKNGSPFTTPIGAGKVIKGWDTGLVGQTVGSQVLLVVPPDSGYGAQASQAIPANSTLIFVVDILDAS